VEGTIQAMLDVAMDRMGMDFPLADLLADNPQQSMVSDITAGGEVGTATIDGVQCKHFFLIQVPDHDMELWLEDNDKALPRRIIITTARCPADRPSSRICRTGISRCTRLTPNSPFSRLRERPRWN
jgi:hypothetical protein